MSSIKEQIRAEIERQKEINKRLLNGQLREGCLYAFSQVLSFLDTLPEQPASEGLEEELEKMWLEWCEDVDYLVYASIARHFAEWGMNQCHLPEGLGKAAEGSDFRDKLAEYMKSAAEEGGYVLSSEAILKMAEEELLKRGFIQKPAEMKEDEVLRNRHKELQDSLLNLCDTVERYTNGAALRSELLNTVNATRLKMR